ncbi:MAG: hypothetical protein HQ582_09275, partial [Planctomycetes bacterium]|nr:hypothetical protein [Planctomycetota bacterium]
WYDPDVGRFVSEDPISFAAGDANLYRYVGNSPVIYVDPSGLCYDGFVDTTNSSQQSHQAVDERYSSYPGDVSVPDPATSDGPSTPTAPASGSFWGALGTAWSYASGVGDWAWNHGLAQGIAPLLPFGDILVTQKTAADERARASQVYDNARDAGYSPAGAAGLGGGVVAGDVTGVTGASYWLPGIDTDPVTGRRYSGSERFFRGALGLTQLGLIGYGLGKTFVSPRLGSTNAGGPCFVAGTQVALAAEEQPIMVAALVDGGDGGNAHARDIAGSLLVSAAGVGLVYDCASRRRRRKHRQGHSKPWDGLLTGDHGGAMQPEFEEESVEAPGAADSSQMPDESSLTVAASRRYAELAEDVAVTTDMQRRENPVDTRPPRIRFGPLRWAAVALCLLAGFLWWGGPEPSSTPSSARLVSATAAAAPGLAQPSTKDIEAIRVGDLVLAQDPETGENCAKRVTQVFRHTADHVRVLEIAVGEESGTQTIRTTDNHPFWVPGQDWVDAGELRVGDPVLQSDGHTATITKSHREEHPRGVEVYNFEVEGFHTYFVAANSLNARPVLVHNKPKSYNPGGSQGKAGGPSARHTPGKGHTRKSGPGQKKRFQKKAAEKRSAKQAAKDAARKKWDSLTPEQKKLLPELNPGG